MSRQTGETDDATDVPFQNLVMSFRLLHVTYVTLLVDDPGIKYIFGIFLAY